MIISYSHGCNLREPFYRHIQSLRELCDGLGGSRAASAFEIGQVTLTDTRYETQM